MKPDSNKRIYFNRYGEWVERNVDPIYDQFVTKMPYIENCHTYKLEVVTTQLLFICCNSLLC